jgi:hypothetical protein
VEPAIVTDLVEVAANRKDPVHAASMARSSACLKRNPTATEQIYSYGLPSAEPSVGSARDRERSSRGTAGGLGTRQSRIRRLVEGVRVSLPESGGEDGTGGPVGDGKDFVRVEAADVAQDLDRLTTGDETERRFESTELIVGDGVAERFEDGRDHTGAAAFARVGLVVADPFSREPDVHVMPSAGAVQPLVGERVAIQQVDEFEQAILDRGAVKRSRGELLDLAHIDVDR